MAPLPTLLWEQKLAENDPKKIVAGIDEVGRGALAGDVVAAAVILNGTLIKGINDSKKLSEKKREEIAAWLHAHAAIGVGAASAGEIDRLGIVAANFLAMRRAVDALPQKPDSLLVDGPKVPPDLAREFETMALVRGDSLSLSIAAASIVAKTTRDKHMKALARAHPAYQWQTNVGYGTKAHLAAIEAEGATPYHRLTFAPLKHTLTAY